MKYILVLLIGVLCSYGKAQVRYTGELNIMFETGEYTLDLAAYYDVSKSSYRSEGRIGLVASGFRAVNYTEYQKLFAENECHVTEETWKHWKETLGRYEPKILADIILKKDGITYGLTKYTLEYDNKLYLVAQLHKQVDGKWYYVSYDENVERMDMIMFFTCVRESFFDILRRSRASLLKNKKLFTQDGALRGDLIMAYHKKYRPEDPLSETLNLVFEDHIKTINTGRSSTSAELIAYFQKSGIPQSELIYLINLLNASLYGEAISYFSELTQKSLDQIIQECPNALDR